MCGRRFADDLGDGVDRACGSVQIARFTEQTTESHEGRRCDSIACGSGLVCEHLRALNQRFVVIRGKIEASVFLVFEALQQCVGQSTRKL